MQNAKTPISSQSQRLIKLAEVRQRTALSKTTIYLLIQQGKFPSSVRLGERAVAWAESEVDDWIADRITDRG